MLYNFIFCRKSVRKYDMTPLSAGELEGINTYVSEVSAPVQDGAVELRCLSHGEVSGFAVKAPHYMLACADSSGFGWENAGYILQNLSLYLTEIGIGSCFAGMAKPQKKLSEKCALPPVIILAFGRPAEALLRKDTSEFKRKSISDILEGPYFADLVEPVRFAPSAMNMQPWFFVDNNGALDIYRQRAGGFLGAPLEKMNRVDMGIALCHLSLSAQRQGKTMKLLPGAGGGQRMSLIPVARAVFS